MMSSALAVLLATAMLPGQGHPVYLTARESGGMIRLQVHGLSAQRFAGRFTVEARSGSNRLVQSGSARLDPDTPVTLVSLDVTRAKDWRAVLRVRPDNGVPYEIQLMDDGQPVPGASEEGAP